MPTHKPEPARHEPILAVVTPGPNAPADPEADTLLKGKTEPTTSAVGTPPAGVSSLDQATSGGPSGFLQLLGPGLVTGASDDDPSGIGTYSQVGSQFGFGLLWTAIFTFPLMVAVQEMCARIALHTGAGLGVSLRKKFPTPLIVVATLALFAANSINIGADLGAVATGAELLTKGHIHEIWLVVPAGILVCALQLFASYSIIFKVFKYLTLALFAYVITVFLSHPDPIALAKATLIPHMEFNAPFITALVAVLGTTISPYLFFWQASSEVDEMKAAGLTTRQQRRGVSARELKAARLDIMVGMAFSQIVMYSIIATNGAVLNAHGITNVQTATDAAQALQPFAGQFAFILFSVGLIGTGLLAIPILAGSAAYAIKEAVGFRGNLAVKPRYRPTFYAIIVLAIGIGAALNFAGVNPITALFITAVINGILAPPLLLLITLLASDKKIMGEQASGRLSRTVCWIATGLMGAAVVGLAYTTLPIFPH